MSKNQINLKVDETLYDHICRKSARNGISNQEFLRNLVTADFEHASEGDLQLLNRYGEWAAVTTLKKMKLQMPGFIEDALKKELDVIIDELKLSTGSISDHLDDCIGGIQNSKKYVTASYGLLKNVPNEFKNVKNQQTIIFRIIKGLQIWMYGLVTSIVIIAIVFIKGVFL